MSNKAPFKTSLFKGGSCPTGSSNPRRLAARKSSCDVRLLVGAIFGLMIGLAACASPNAVQQSENTSSTSKWDAEVVRNHIRLLNSSDMEGRSTASRGFLRAADYVQGQLREMGLQPILSGEYRLQYAAVQHYISRSTVQLIGPDSLNLQRGIDYILHQNEQVASVQFSPRVNGLLEFGAYEAHSDVQTESTVSTSSIHVAGYIPGQGPDSRDSLIVLIAPLDGWGAQGIQSFSDGSDLGASATALLEVVRNLSDMQRKWAVIGPSIFVAFVSGTKGVCDGPGALLRTFPWAKSYLKSVVILSDANDCNWSEIVAAERIAAPVTVLESDNISMLNDPSTSFIPWARREKYLRSPYLDRLVSDAMSQAETAYGLIWKDVATKKQSRR